MDKKLVLVLTLVTVFITFGFWLSSIVTKSWFVLSLKTTSIQPPSILKNILSLNSLLNLNNIIPSKTISLPVRLELSIFYCTLCTAGNCVRVPFDNLPSAISAVVENLPAILELQIMSTVAISLCVIGFFLLMLNFGSSSRVRAGGITILVAALSEFFLILRMVIATIQTTLDSVESTLSLLDLKVIDIEVQTPYSIILAGIGLVFIILGLVACRALHSKLREQSTDGQMLNLVPSISPVNFTIHQERY